jgi:UDP-N-acetylmuramyl pentapeptide phosphotransferase/UDP-N-acetylglucosamine-1-phosphate transferase
MEYKTSLILTIYSFCVCLVLTKYLIYYLPKIGLIDTPSKRRIHTNATPTAGGIGIILAIYSGILIYDVPYNLSVICATSLVGIISLIDDAKQVNILIRLAFHFISGLLAVHFFLDNKMLFHGELPKYLDFMLAVFCFVGFLNLYNFLDGSDGITCIETIHLSIVAIILCYLKCDIIENTNMIIQICSMLLGGSVAFFIFNKHPAKIFLGDVGSITIGCIIGICLMMIAASSARLFAACCIASLYYIADGGITILIRLLNKEKIWQPHLKHFFQKAIQNGISPKEIVKKIAICNFILMMLAIGALYFPSIAIIIAFVVVLILLIHFHYYKQIIN